MIATIAEKKKNFSNRSDHMKPLSSDRSDNNRWDIKSSLSAIIVAVIAGEGFPFDRWTFLSRDRRDRSNDMETGLNLSQ